MSPTAAYEITALPGVPEIGAEGILVPSPRGRMLDAITALVAEQGYADTSVADVISRAGTSRKTFYEQFTDKEDCFLAAYQLVSDYVAGRLADALSETEPMPAEPLARVLYEAYLEIVASMPLAARAFMVEIRAAGAPSQRHRRAIHDRFAELFNVPGTEDDPLLRTAVVAASEELVAREIIDRGTDNLPGLAPVLTKLATRILAAV